METESNARRKHNFLNDHFQVTSARTGHGDTQLGMLMESLRVLKDGGTLHFNSAFSYPYLIKHIEKKGYKVEIESSNSETSIQLKDKSGPDCDFIQSFSEGEIDQIQDLRQMLSRAKEVMYPPNTVVTTFESLLVIKKISGPETSSTSHDEQEDRMISFLSLLHRGGAQSLKEFNGYVRRSNAFGSEPAVMMSGIARYVELLTKTEGTAPLMACYGFIPLWKSLGQGSTPREQIETGLKRWRQDLVEGKPVPWPNPEAPCSAQEYMLDLKTGSVTQQ